MSRFPETALAAALVVGATAAALADDMPNAFRVCTACHEVGDMARHKVGPQLDGLIGRPAGTAPGYRYSSAMTQKGEQGLVWTAETLATYLRHPKDFVPGTNMAFAGIQSDDDIRAVVDYLASHQDSIPDSAAPVEPPAATPAGPVVIASYTHEGGVFGLGRVATADEVAAWDVDVRPDGTGLPEGSGSVADGDAMFQENCATCHGVFGEGVGRWPVLAGGQDTLTNDRPEKTIGSYWPYLSTVFDYIRRAMPFGNAHSLSNDEVYALTAYLLYMNDVVGEDFVLSKENFTSIRLPNEGNFIPDTREEEPEFARPQDPCMTNCMAGPATIVMRARILDVTPGNIGDDEAASAGAGAVE